MPADARGFAFEATRRGLAVANSLFPATFKPDMPHVLRISIGLLARCVTTTEACLHLAELGRRSDLIVCARTLFEHTVMFAWLVGSDEAEQRMMLWERYCDEQALRFDDEIGRLGGETRITAETRAQIADAAARLGTAKMPGLADRSAQVDREWADRLGFDRDGRELWSLRRTYSVIFRVGSAVAHPTLAGLSFVTDRKSDRVVIDVEAAGLAHEALLPVPLLLGTALSVSAHALGRPSIGESNRYVEWLAAAGEAAAR